MVRVVCSSRSGHYTDRAVGQPTVIADCLPGFILAVDHQVVLLFCTPNVTPVTRPDARRCWMGTTALEA